MVGITGGIGAGKSTVSRIFKLLGIPVYDADSRAKALMSESPALSQAIIKEFGPRAYRQGHLNRQYLAEKVFTDEKLVAKLNALVHPAVADDFSTWYQHQHTAYVLKEAALLFETGSYQSLDATILVTCPLETRIARVQQRDPQRSSEQINNIMARQIPVAAAKKLADYIIYNDEKTMLIPQVLTLHNKLRQKAGPPD